MGEDRKSRALVHKKGVNKKHRAGDFIHKLFNSPGGLGSLGRREPALGTLFPVGQVGPAGIF
jgi:hypothetical protein